MPEPQNFERVNRKPSSEKADELLISDKHSFASPLHLLFPRSNLCGSGTQGNKVYNLKIAKSRGLLIEVSVVRVTDMTKFVPKVRRVVCSL